MPQEELDKADRILGYLEAQKRAEAPSGALKLTPEEQLAQFLCNNLRYPTEKYAWDGVLGSLAEACEESPRELDQQIDPLDKGEVLRDLAQLPARENLLLLLENGVDLKETLREGGDLGELLTTLHLLVRPLLQLEDWAGVG